MTNQSNQQGLGCVSGNDDAAIHATTQEARAGSKAKVAAMIGPAVAAIAVALKDRQDALRIEGD